MMKNASRIFLLMTGVMVATICLVLYFKQPGHGEPSGRKFPPKATVLTTDYLRRVVQPFPDRLAENALFP